MASHRSLNHEYIKGVIYSVLSGALFIFSVYKLKYVVNSSVQQGASIEMFIPPIIAFVGSLVFDILKNDTLSRFNVRKTISILSDESSRTPQNTSSVTQSYNNLFYTLDSYRQMWMLIALTGIPLITNSVIIIYLSGGMFSSYVPILLAASVIGVILASKYMSKTLHRSQTTVKSTFLAARAIFSENSKNVHTKVISPLLDNYKTAYEVSISVRRNLLLLHSAIYLVIFCIPYTVLATNSDPTRPGDIVFITIICLHTLNMCKIMGAVTVQAITLFADTGCKTPLKIFGETI